MKRLMLGSLICMLVLGSAAGAFAKPRLYKWVEDKRVSSDNVLRKPQYSRVVPMTEEQTLDLVKRIMTRDLYMGLAQFHTTRQQQNAETTPDTVLPEEVVRQRRIELIDDDYRFVLKVGVKRYGNRTRVDAEAVPVYRIRDMEAEDARDDSATGGSSVEVKVRSEHGGAVSLGPIIVAPVLGLPGDYGVQPLPDAGQRGGEIVKSFMYFMDKHVKDLHGSAPVMDDGEGAVEVDVNVRTGQ